MDEEIKKYIDESLEKKKPGFLKSHWVEIIAVVLSAFALFISFMSYKVSYDEANPKVNYEIINDYSTNSREFLGYLERYLNDWTFTDKNYNFYLKIKNVNPSISSKLDLISGEIELEFWAPVKDTSSSTIKYDKISDETIYLPGIPIKVVTNKKEQLRPIINDLLEGYIKYEYPKDADWFYGSRYTNDKVYDKVREFNYFDVYTTYSGTYPFNYKPKPEDKLLMQFHHESSFFDLPKNIEDIYYDQFIKVIIRVNMKISDNLNNIYENKYTLLYDGWFDNPYYYSAYKTALELFNNKDFEKAKEILISINDRNKYNSNVSYLLGLIYLIQNKEEIGVEFLKSASNRSDIANLELAQYYLSRKKNDEAIKYLEKYCMPYYYPRLDLTIDAMKMIENKIINQLNINNQSQKFTISTTKSFSKCFYVLGINYMEHNLLDEAEYFLKKANDLNNHNISINEKLGIVYFRKENFSESLKLFSECVQLANRKDWEIIGSGTNRKVYNTYRIGNTYRKLEMYKESLKIFKNMLTTTEMNVWNYFGNAGLGFLYFDLGELSLSRSYFVKAKNISDKSEYIKDYLNEEIKDKLSMIDNNLANK